ncbi:hypothetical protein UP10_31500 [Bradyrhizobium sp. LTSPM299]|nr:hypothetical protein UP10_31500 [Bradyrhizobium sp. LTSPM299]
MDLPIKDHPFFTYLPVWDKPGMLTGAEQTADFKTTELHKFSYVPDHFRRLLSLGTAETLTFPLSAPLRLSENQFSRSLAKIAYCTAVTRYGLQGFDRKTITDFILGNYPYAPFLVGGSTDAVLPSMPGLDHLIALAEIPINEVKTLLGFVRLFAKSGTAAEGMPIYTVVLGASVN